MYHKEIYIEQSLREDKSFRDKVTGIGALFGGGNQQKERDIWEKGVKSGFDRGIQYAIDNYSFKRLGTIADTEKEKEFYQKLMDLHREYGLGIQWHPVEGMVFKVL